MARLRVRELKQVRADIAAAEQTIDRYLVAFENGTMPETLCAPRIEALAAKTAELRDREAELTDLLAHPLPAANHDLLRDVRHHIRDVLDDGRPETTKTLLAALIDHIDISDRTSIKPTFRVPLSSENETAPIQQEAVREMCRSVGHRHNSLTRDDAPVVDLDSQPNVPDFPEV